MISLPKIQDKPQPINSAVGTGNKSVGWLKAAMADSNLFHNRGLLRDWTARCFQHDLWFPSFQPSIEQITLLLG